MPIREPRHALLAAALLLGSAVGSASAAAPDRAPASITIGATPRQVELGPDAHAVLHITAPEPPVVTASVGRIETVRAVGQGSYEATYFPPGETFPQIAIIAATTSRGFGWLALPLAGTGEVAVKTEPNANASITIGSTRFGPVRADGTGRALIRIVVPPGVRHAMNGSRRMALNTPEVSHVHVMADRATVTADDLTNVGVRAFAVTPDGKPRRGAPLALTATEGTLSQPREIAPGVFEASWALPPGPAGPVTVAAALRGEPASRSRATVSREAAAPRRIHIEVERDSVVAGEGVFDFALVVEDGAGNAVVDVAPRASTSFGSLLALTRGTPGRWMGNIGIPERLDGASHIRITATAGEVVTQRSVAVLPGPTADVAVEPSATEARGRSAIPLAVTTVDRFGNPTDAASPSVVALLGTVEPPERRGVGTYRVVYRPPAEPAAPRDEITIRAGATSRVSRVQLYTPDPPLLQVTPKAGIVARSGSFGPSAGAEAALWTQVGGAQLGLALEGRWFSFSGRSAIPGTSFTVDGQQSYLAFTASPSWRRPLGRSAMVWASVGGGVARVQNRSRLTDQPQLDESGWAATGTAAVSVGARLWGGFPFLELRASYVADPALAGLTGAFTPFFLSAGYRFDAF